jgi:outer membrane protein assembly factor BamB
MNKVVLGFPQFFRYLICYIVFVAIILCSCQKGNNIDKFIPTNHYELDNIRRELNGIPTNAENFDERKNALYIYSRLLMFSGAKLSGLNDSIHQGHYNIVQPRYPIESAISDMNYSPAFAAEIDYQYQVLDSIYAEFKRNPDKLVIDLVRDTSTLSKEVTDWPSMRGDEGSTALTMQSGPLKGELLWKFPMGHAWYAQPFFEDGKIYIGSPGISYEAYCIDAQSGEFVWKSIPKTGWNPYWKNYSSRSSSPAFINGDNLIIRKMQVGSEHGVPDEHLVFIDKNSGKRKGGINNKGFLSSCVGYTPLAFADDYLVYPHGVQAAVDNYKGVGQDFPFDSLKCNRASTKEHIWSYFIGETFAEPVIYHNKVYCGNQAGEMHCVDLISGEKIWVMDMGYPISGKVTVEAGKLYFSTDEGQLLAMETNSGKTIWKNKLPEVKQSVRLCSSIALGKETLYIGSADKHIYAINKKDGTIISKSLLDDWVRAKPVIFDDYIFAATLSGSLYKLSLQSLEIEQKTEVSAHSIYSDINIYNEDLFLVSSDFYIHKINLATGEKDWQTSTFESVHTEEGERILADLVGQPDYQSSAIVVDDVAYVGGPRFIYAIEVDTGKELWKFETLGQVCGAPAYADGKIFIGQRGGTPYFYCLDANNGKPIWKKKLGWVWASAHCKENKVFVSNENGTFYCLSQKDGSLVWKKETNNYSYPVPSFYKDLVYFGSWHDYYAFNANTGELVWKFDMGQGQSDSGTSLVKDGLIYIQGAASTDFFCLDALTGTEVWRHTLKECNVSPASDGKYLIFCNWEGLLVRSPGNAFTYCIDAKTGKKLYELDFAGLSGAVICNDLVFSASSTDPYFKAWDLPTGTMRWRYKMGGRAEESCTTIYGDKAFVVATDGYLYAFH